MNRTFISQDKNYIVEFTKKEFSIFKDELNSCNEKSMYKIDFKTSIGNIIKSINISDIDLSILLDNLHYFIETNQDCIYSFKCSSIPVVITTIRISYVLNEYILNTTGEMKYNIYFEYYESKDDYMNMIFKFDITDNLNELIEIIYDLCINSSTK